jgi:hypothetical protein
MDMSLLCFIISLFLYLFDYLVRSSLHSWSHFSSSMMGSLYLSMRDLFLTWMLLHLALMDFLSSKYCYYFSFFCSIKRDIFYLVFVINDSDISYLSLKGLFDSLLRIVQICICFMLIGDDVVIEFNVWFKVWELFR